MVSNRYRICRDIDKIGAFLRSGGKAVTSGKRRGFPPPFPIDPARRYQRSSWSTLACDWFASASAETAIDWRVDSAWLWAVSWLVSASVRFDEPACSTLIRFLEKS